jgi:hypothetical protein
MATTANRNQGKSAFLKEFLLDNPKANPVAANEAWIAAGMPGTVSPSLVNKLRSKLKLTGNLKAGRKPKSASVSGRVTHKTAAGRKPGRKPTGLGRELSQIEAELDRLIYRVMGLDGLEDVAEQLRATRRALYPHYAS